jgi:hypothetical protein
MQLVPDPQVPAAVCRPSVEERHLEIHLVESPLPRAAVARMIVKQGSHETHGAFYCPVADLGGGLAGRHLSLGGLHLRAPWQKANLVHTVQCDHQLEAADHVLLDHWALGSVAPYM